MSLKLGEAAGDGIVSWMMSQRYCMIQTLRKKEINKKIRRDNIFYFLHIRELIEALDRRAKTSFFQLICFKEVITNSNAICRGGGKRNNFHKYLINCGSVFALLW